MSGLTLRRRPDRRAARPARDAVPVVLTDRYSPLPRKVAVRVIGYGLLALGTLLYLGPFLVQVATSFKTDADAVANPVSLIPSPVSMAAWEIVAGSNPAYSVPVFRWLGNSFFVTISVTLGRLIIDSLAGYALARLRFRGRTVVFAGVVAVLAVPGVVLLIPKFLVLNELGMFDSYSGMILPLFCDAVGILLMKTAFEAVPTELDEAARIDGAGVFRTFWSVILPLVRPALVTVTILSFQGSWNEFTHFLIATSDPDLATMNLGIARLTAGGDLQGSQQFPLKLALATLSTIPIAIVYVFFSRYFMRSGSATGLK
ncbi:carbohydrate ABC transporter permease [Jiangella anatolica]|uniref:ABC transporter permease n=1 Tax=Jiangella anatolica TaxID=2670374 RepID=A0A2W2BVH0_9ACTN|nr:carbohydrate ABC transporter permease [Jiangella anatolica]PZF80159.1 ABC transporter permease [Jiangella anatolica]